MKLLIVDGLSETRNYYLDRIACEYKNEVYQAVSAEDAAFWMLDIKPDIIITSEILSFRNGFELARLAQKSEMPMPVIVIANDADNAIQAISNGVFDFLLMPVSAKTINYSIEKAVRFIEEKRAEIKENADGERIRIRVKTANGYRLIDIDKLLYCEAEGAYSHLFFSDGSSYYTTYNLGRIEKLIENYRFIRINRSALVSLGNIREINKKEGLCIMNDEKLTQFKITKNYIRKLEAELII
ncbi:MAG: response regulator transcription factor [Prolixibacteraceae bacterium]|nr:response regulator transcription factor [Prolixibacteraceae bacterium]MBN2649594.1 response regulator transcription factor [Prolixibacteraceae bacterium]